MSKHTDDDEHEYQEGYRHYEKGHPRPTIKFHTKQFVQGWEDARHEHEDAPEDESKADLDILKRHYNLHPDAPLSREKTIAEKDAKIELLTAALKALADTSRAYLEHMDAEDVATLEAARAAIAKAEGAS